MSRSNPNKKKKRDVVDTLLIFGEGYDEEVFLKHLRSMYSYNSNKKITIKKGKGGDPKNIVIDASKIPGGYTKRVVLLDNDKSKLEMDEARLEAKNRCIDLIENTPCLEYLLLTILNKALKGKKSAWCKSEFEKKFIDKKKRCEAIEYKKIFPKKLLEVRRLKIAELNKLILIMEGR